MNQSEEIKSFDAYLTSWLEQGHSANGTISEEHVEAFAHHLNQLKPIADSGDLEAKYAIVKIYVYGLIYSSEEVRRDKMETDRVHISSLLEPCALGGMAAAFDNLVVMGVGDVADSARKAAKEYEQNHAPYTEEHNSVMLPVYDPEWMEGAMQLWLENDFLK